VFTVYYSVEMRQVIGGGTWLIDTCFVFNGIGKCGDHLSPICTGRKKREK